MAAYYNEIDHYAAQWLRNLIKAGLIADGEVDERSIEEVQADELKGFTQCHFFAGIGGWSYAARLAGWDDDRPLWTGSCPCQPFSAAGKQRGTSDERHLWPVFYELIRQSNPPVVFGEQVASRLGRDWLAGVRADLETVGYAVGAADLCAASVGAPHIRQRLWWVADSTTDRREQKRSDGSRSDERIEAQGRSTGFGLRSTSDWVADSNHQRLHGEYPLLHGEEPGRITEDSPEAAGSRSECSGVADSDSGRAERQPRNNAEAARFQEAQCEPEHGSALSERSGADRGGRRGDGESSGVADSHNARLQGRVSGRQGTEWTPEHGLAGRNGEASTGRNWDGIYIPCADGKARRLEPSIEPLAHGVSNRVGRLRAYGNAIVPQVAAEFIKAVM